MSLDYLEKINKGPTDKNHKRLLELVYGLAAVTVIIWAVIYVQLRWFMIREAPIVSTSTNPGTIPVVTIIITTQLLPPEERQKILTDLQSKVSQTKPLTNTERNKILTDLKKEVASQSNQ